MARPRRDGTGHFELAGHLVAGATGRPVASLARLVLGPSHLVRRGADGRIRWRIPLPGVRSVRPPDTALAPGVAVASVDDRLFAFRDADGAPLWRAPGPAERLAVVGRLVLTTGCPDGHPPCHLVARRAGDVKVAWRATLPTRMTDPDALLLEPRRIVVTDTLHEVAAVFGHAGKRRFHVDEGVPTAWPLGDDLLLFTNRHVIRIDASGHVRWKRKALAETFVAGNDVVPVGHDLLVANFCRISDSGADVVRLDPRTGTTVWETRIGGLGVGHSQYLQVAYLAVRGGEVYLVSQASGGAFFEGLDLPSGRREQRCVLAGSKADCTQMR